MSEERLKPCPFCGGEVEVKSCSSNFFDSVFEIVCRECGCRQAPSIHKEAVINAWNIRKPMDDIVEQLKKKREQCFDSSSEIEETGNIMIADRYFYKGMGLINAIQIVKGGVED